MLFYSSDSLHQRDESYNWRIGRKLKAVQNKQRYRICITGIIQGVGFRPFIFGLAQKHALTGFVRNSSQGVEIEVQSESISEFNQFYLSITKELPPLARIDSLTKVKIAILTEETDFQIKESKNGNEKFKDFPIIPPADSSTCTDCFLELFDQKDRRFRFPFINCTNCGPRFTIINKLPYDRIHTSMEKFQMCQKCTSEYEDPHDRRFHAQPNACFDCGPKLCFEPGNLSGESAIAKAVDCLKRGEIVALKGLGGFQLLCDASNLNAVAKLRERKNRPFKPLAVMIENIQEAQKHCVIDEISLQLLSGVKGPIVIVPKRDKFTLASNLSINSDQIGIMLPYTGLHHLLVKDFGGPVLATSGNLSEEPIARDNEEARQDLKSIADAFLMHNRDIVMRYDDSVAYAVDGKPVILRRARGFAPDLIELDFNCQKNILALGGHLKSTFAIAKEKQAIISQHLSDLDEVKSVDNFKEVLTQYQNMFKFKPDILVRDLHPDYATSRLCEKFAKELGLNFLAVQHHHAHIAACMCEYKLKGPVIGVAFDGLGMGNDDTLWGGEFLLCNFGTFERLAHLKPVAMPGGSLAIKEPWRMMLGILASFDQETQNCFDSFVQELKKLHGQSKLDIVQKQIQKSTNSPLTSSAGRIFDAVASLLGVCNKQHYEGQAALELESLARPYLFSCAQTYKFDFEEHQTITQINTQNLFVDIAKDLSSGLSKGMISFKFHQTFKQIIASICHKIRLSTGCSTVCLSGGVFQNRILLELVKKELTEQDFQVYFPTLIACNDSGLSLGQIAIAAHSR